MSFMIRISNSMTPTTRTAMNQGTIHSSWSLEESKEENEVSYKKIVIVHLLYVNPWLPLSYNLWKKCSDVLKYLHSSLVCRSNFSIRLCAALWWMSVKETLDGKYPGGKPSSSITARFFFCFLSFFCPPVCQLLYPLLLTKLLIHWNWKNFNRKMDFYNLSSKFWCKKLFSQFLPIRWRFASRFP